MFVSHVGYAGVPARLSTVSSRTAEESGPLLAPYPDWSWHARGDCNGITSVYGLAVSISHCLSYTYIYIRRGTVSFRQILFFFFSVFANRPNCWLDMWTFYCKRKNTAGREKYRYIKRHTCVCARGERSRVDASRTFWRSMVSRESCVMTGVRLCFFLTLRLVVVGGCRRPYIESRSYRHFSIFHFFYFSNIFSH